MVGHDSKRKRPVLIETFSLENIFSCPFAGVKRVPREAGPERTQGADRRELWAPEKQDGVRPDAGVPVEPVTLGAGQSQTIFGRPTLCLVTS